MFTSGKSLMVPGLVRKKKPSVMWKSERDTTMVLDEMSGMLGDDRPRLGGVRGRSNEEDWRGEGSDLSGMLIGATGNTSMLAEAKARTTRRNRSAVALRRTVRNVW